MGDIFFVLKTLAITITIVVLMQIKIGPRTIEQHSLAWIHQSVVVEQLQEVAAGAVKAGRQGVIAVKGMLGIKTNTRDAEVEKIGADAMSAKAERK